MIRSSPQGSAWFLAPALVLAALLYAPGLAGGFVFDDFPNILRNEAIRQARFDAASLWEAMLSSPSGPLARPIASLSFALQVASQGLAAPAMKAANLAIHLGCGLLLFLWLRALVDAPRIAPTVSAAERRLLPLLVTTAWLLAPIHLTTVLYVVQRMESLSVLFTLAGLLVYTRGRLRMQAGQGRVWMPFAGLAVMTGLATLTKETGILTPLYALLLEAIAFGFRTGRRRDGGVMGYALGVCVLPVVATIALTLPDALSGESYGARPFTLAERLLTEGRILWAYLAAIVLPRLPELSLYHDDFPLSRAWLAPPTTLLAWLGLACLAGLAIVLRRRNPVASLGLGMFFAGHALVSTYLPLELYHEHRNYLPAAGIFLALVSGGLRLAPRLETPRVMLLAFVAWLVLQGGTTLMRATEWSDPVRLAYVEATRHPASPRANYELGLMLSIVSQGPGDPRHGLALATFREAAQLPHADLLPLQALIFLTSRQGQPIEPEWWHALEKAASQRALSAADKSALFALVDCVTRRICAARDAPALDRVLAVAVDHHPGDATVYAMAARLRLHAFADEAGAERLLQAALAHTPRDPELWLSLAEIQARRGEHHWALQSLERSAEFDRFGRLARRRAALHTALSAS